MMLLRALVWAGAFGWAIDALDFAVSAALRAFAKKDGVRLRLTWGGAAVGSCCFLLSRLGALEHGQLDLPLLLREALDIGLAMGGVVSAIALVVTLSHKGLEVLR